MGIGGAVQAGHKYALRHGYDIDVQVDGDGQHDPSYIGNLIEPVIDGADLSIVPDLPFPRKAFSLLF